MLDHAPHILVVDDDKRLRELLKDYLSAHSFNVTTAQHAADARRKLAGIEFDLIVLDVMMPELTGWEVCKNLRSRDEFEHTGIVMLTAIGESLNEMTSPLYGADAHVDKPFNFDDVSDAIAAVLLKRCGVSVLLS